jgi:thiamine biosynthesis lipoprotein
MKSVQRRAFVIALAASLFGCDSEPVGFEQRYFAMATWVDVVVDPSPDDSTAARLDREIESMLRRYEQDFYAWGDGELAALNERLEVGGTMAVSSEMAELLRQAVALSNASDGRFDPSVAPLVELWGFHDDNATDLPSSASIEAALASNPGLSALELAGSTAGSDATGLKLDLGGIAKGYVVDQILGLLLERGIETAMVNAGGDLRVIGTRRDRPWRIGIQAPRDDGLLGVIELEAGEAAFTSGDYERYIEREGERQHHLLDPSTGRPAQHTQAVTVIAVDGTTADAAATALFVAGPERWPAIAEALGVRHVLRVDASGRVEATPSMRDRLQTRGGDQSDILTVHL